MYLQKIDRADIVPPVALCSPVFRRSYEGSFSDMARRAGTIISGDANSGKASHLKVIAEDLLFAKAQIAALTMDNSWRGLQRNTDGSPTGFDLLCLDGSIAGFQLDVESAIPIARFIAETETSVTIPIRALTYKDRGAFLTLFLEELGRHNKGDLTVMVQGMDALFPSRARGPESTAVSNFHHTIVAGKENGISFIGSVENLCQLSLSILRALPTMIVTRTSSPLNVKATASKLQDQRIATHAFSDFGIARLGFHDHWIWPFCDQDMLDEEVARYLPLREFKTQVGINTAPNFDVMPVGTLKDLLNRITLSKAPKTPANDQNTFVSSIPASIHKQFTDRDFDAEIKQLTTSTNNKVRVALAIADGAYTFQKIAAATNINNRALRDVLTRLGNERCVVQVHDVYRLTTNGHNTLLSTPSMMMARTFAQKRNVDLRAELHHRWGISKADRVISYMLGRGYLKENANGMLVVTWPNQEEY